MPSKRSIDWSQQRCRKILVEQRRFLWYPESTAMFAAWAGLRRGMTVVDVGCGLGYMGRIYWPHFGRPGRSMRRGRYIGVDRSARLVVRAQREAHSWAATGGARFLAADAYRLPLPDSCADAVMCQTLLMHLTDPRAAVAEMARILKPGGVMICHEPDNLSSSMTCDGNSLPKRSLDEELFLRRINFYRHRGHIELGGGDSNIGNKVPSLMRDAGLREIGIRQNDKVFLLLPPYEDQMQRQRLQDLRRQLRDKKGIRYWRQRDRREILAGGGTPAEYRRYRRLTGKEQRLARRQIKEGTTIAVGTGVFYIIKARKPAGRAR